MSPSDGIEAFNYMIERVRKIVNSNDHRDMLLIRVIVSAPFQVNDYPSK